MANKNVSPRISSIKWGHITTGDGSEYKDAKLYPGGSRTWDWNETGTHHVPGIQPADVQELLDNGAEIVVLSRGFHKRLQVSRKTKKVLDRHDISYHILETGKAVEKYNELCNNLAVGALIHSTC